MPIQAPKEKPATQQAGALGLTDCSQSSAEAAADSSPQDRKALFHEHIVKVIDNLVVHGAAVLRMRVKDHRNGRAGRIAVVIAAFEAAFGAGENNFRHCNPSNPRNRGGADV
jgi:hypothetical protein